MPSLQMARLCSDCGSFDIWRWHPEQPGGECCHNKYGEKNMCTIFVSDFVTDFFVSDFATDFSLMPHTSKVGRKAALRIAVSGPFFYEARNLWFSPISRFSPI